LINSRIGEAVESALMMRGFFFESAEALLLRMKVGECLFAAIPGGALGDTGLVISRPARN
jgi:hypothetical protein